LGRRVLARAGFPGPGPASDPLLQRYLRDAATFDRGMRTVTVNPITEVDAIARIGASLRAEVSQRAIAIELNPTSNLLVGDLSDLMNHPLWRLAPPRPNPDLPPLSVTVGSDDPVVFNCRLPLEYQLLYDTLIVAGLTDLEAMEWLERVRRTGLERRFTVRTHKNELESLLDIQLSGDPPPPRIVSQG
jgi:adenosine deaminase